MTDQTNHAIPVLPLRDVVVYPHMVIPLFVGREKSINALDTAMQEDKKILLIAQKNAEIDDPAIDDIHEIGTLSTILQLLKLPDGTVKVLVEGAERVRITGYEDTDAFFTAHIELLEQESEGDQKELDILTRSLLAMFDQYVKLNKKVPPEILTSLSGIEEPGRLADTIAAHMSLKLDEKQKILEINDSRARLERLMVLIEGEIDIMQIEKRIRGRVKQQMEKSQREYYLNEQMKAIQKELGDMEDAPNELEELEQKIEKAGMSKEAKEKATAELNKLKMMSPMSAEATVVRNYVDWLVNVPWKKRSKIRHDLAAAEAILEEDHYGLDKVKERILEYLAVQQRVKKLKGPILCLVGPPGVGKTSLGRSIARATGRKFVRMSLGGVRDEAEIRGHRRTYIGSLPGKIIQNLAKMSVRNPLFLLDEMDKMSMDFRGDPSSALLEVLDPEQNHTFGDHYLEVDFDLSDVMFVATANTMNIPAPLLDRMEVIRIPGYTEDEKINIAMRYLLPKQIENNGLKENEISISQNAIRDIVRYYTREAGVRNLEREISKICRKVVKELVLHEKGKKISVTPQEPGKISRCEALPLRTCRRERSGRPGHGARLDRGRWRAADDRIDGRARQGQDDSYGPAGRCHAGVHPGCHDRGPQPLRHAGYRCRFLPEVRCPYPRPGGRNPEGRPKRRCRYVYCTGVGPDRYPGTRRRGDDRRDHAAWRGPADRRSEGEAAGCSSGRYLGGVDSGGKPQGSGRDSEERQG